MLLKAFYLLRGYLRISVSEAFPERFLNLCALEGLHLWGVQIQNKEIRLYCSTTAFKRMRHAAFTSSCRIKILEKHGIGFVLRHFKGRKALWGGLLIFAAALIVSTRFVWTVKVDGNENMTESEIKFLAESCGLKQGVVKYKVNTRKFEEAALKAEPRLAWIYPEIKGTVLYIHVREKAEGEKPTDVKVPCSVVAKRSGVIDEITVKRGRAAVSEGDTVTKGQLLISGDGVLHADGSVKASYWIRKKVKLAGERKTTRTTGRQKTRYTVKIGSFGMRLAFSKKEPYDVCVKEEKTKNVVIFGDVSLPMTVESVTYKEAYIATEKLYEDEEAELSKDEILSEFEKEKDAETSVVSVNSEIIYEEDGAYLSVTIMCNEEIAIKNYSYTEE